MVEGFLGNASTVKPDLMTTSEQRPPVNNGQFESSTASQNLSFIRHLYLTAAFFRSQGWPFYTGLTVLAEIAKIRQVQLNLS
jgi:hypothetical protein